MYTSIALVALSGFFAGTPPKTDPTWHRDYPSARQQGKKEGKPLAVFVGSGRRGFEDVSKTGRLTREMKSILARDYVCVYLDTDRKSGRELARKFRLDQGLVLSDRTGNLQAFRHEGSLHRDDLTYYLKKYSDPDLVVRTTATHATYSTSYYPPEAPVAAPPVQPVLNPGYGGFIGGGYVGSFGGGFGGGGCSS